MRKTSFFLKSSAVFLLFAWVLSGCSLPEWHFLNIVVGGIRAGMVGSSLPGRISYSYRTFTGYESSLLNAEPGQAVTLLRPKTPAAASMCSGKRSKATV